jgi:hypothetical protein
MDIKSGFLIDAARYITDGNNLHTLFIKQFSGDPIPWMTALALLVSRPNLLKIKEDDWFGCKKRAISFT